MQNYRFDIAAQTLQEFVWNEYCDWYVELSKPVLWDDEANPEAAAAARHTLLSILEKSLRLMHPFMPYITEEVWQRIAPLLGIAGDSIMLQPFPLPDADNRDAAAEASIEWIKGVIVGIRNIRGEMDISPAKTIKVFLRSSNADDQTKLTESRVFLQKLAKLESIEWLEPGAEAPAAATQLHGALEILVPMAGLIDVAAEQARLDKEIGKLEGGIKAVGGKLGNAKFVDNAPEAVVAKEREKLAEMESSVTALRAKREELNQLA
jgi:valyl-tRNA synthetase